MTSAPTLSIPDRTTLVTVAEDAHERPRLRLKPKAPTTGYVDGGWWPRSRDLAAELPHLLTVLSVRLGRIERVSYHLAEWGPTIRKINFGGGVVRLAGYRSQLPDTVDVIAAQQRVTLLVVPPEAAAQSAHAALMAAGYRGNTDDVATLLEASSSTMHVLDSDSDSDSDGGSAAALGT
jgi:hypothetical protein